MPRPTPTLWLFRCALLVKLCAAVGWGNPTLYCVALVTPGGYEPHLLVGQHVLKAGIFECDDYAIVTNVSAAELLAGHENVLQQIAPKVYQIQTSLFAPMVRGPPGFDPSSPEQLGVQAPQHWANTPIFLQFWKKLAELGQYQNFQYTVKADLDTVLLPARLSNTLQGRNANGDWNEYFLNTDKDMYGNFLHGPVEVLSKAALSAFHWRSQECEAKFNTWAYGEDYWLNNCLKALGVNPVAGLPLLYDMYTFGNVAQQRCDGLVPVPSQGGPPMYYAAYHPYKDFWGWMKCRMQTGVPPSYSWDWQNGAAQEAYKPIQPMAKFSLFQTVKAYPVACSMTAVLAISCVGLAVAFVGARRKRAAAFCPKAEAGEARALKTDEPEDIVLLTPAKLRATEP